MEGESHRSCFDPALKSLEKLIPGLTYYYSLDKDIRRMHLDLGFFKMFFWGLECWDEMPCLGHFHSVICDMGRELRQLAEELAADSGNGLPRAMVDHYVNRFQQFKLQAKESCIAFLDGGFKCKSYNLARGSRENASETAQFIDLILKNLEVLKSNVGDRVASAEEQIGFVREKLQLFRGFVQLVADLKTGGGVLDKFILHTRIWANHVSCLACLYWIDETNEILARAMGTMLSDLMQKTMPYSPEVISLHLDMLHAARCQDFTSVKFGQLLSKYVDSILPKKDEMEVLREGLLFVLTIVMDPSEEVEGLIWTQIGAIINEVPYVISSIHFDEMRKGEGVSSSNAEVCDFLEKIDRAKLEIREHLIQEQDSLEFNFPRTNAVGFLDFLVGNIKRMLRAKVIFILSVEHHVRIVLEELASLRPFMQNIMELQNKHVGFKDLWTRIIKVVYFAEYAISCSAICPTVWYSILYLPSVIKDLKFLKIQVQESVDDMMYNNIKLNGGMESSDVLLQQSTTPGIEGVLIGFKEDARSIIDHLLGGTKNLTVVAISGMPGQGKTTLAKRIYNDPSVQYHFHKIIWCYVSRECTMRDLLTKIFSGIVDIENIEIQDLAEHLRKSLKRKRYLIVMDDIWDVDLWREVEVYFPDDKNGSRIMFTSRNQHLASQAKPNSVCHHLQLLSDEESWELMKEKVFSSDGCPPEFSGIGKQIAVYCKGLPLAVILIAGLLRRTERKLSLWTQVAEKLKSHLPSEGCMDIIELSYKYLPDHLKACFLYFGAFPRGKYIRAKRLKLLWIAEGFIKENEMQSQEDLAEDYLGDLVNQSLVIVTERSSKGWIKTCDVHDLLYDLCIEKAVEENFVQCVDEIEIVSGCSATFQKYVHHRIYIGTGIRFTKPRALGNKQQLAIGQVRSLWFHGDLWTNKCSTFLNSFKALTMLDLRSRYLECIDFPEAILSMVNLRYIAISAYIEEIPASITELWNLETLIINQLAFVNLPKGLWEMKNLRHAEVGSFDIQFPYSDQKEMSTVQVYKIETLSRLDLYHDCDFDELLRRLPNLKRLSCCVGDDFDMSYDASRFSVFRLLNKLESLRIFCHSSGRISATNFLPENLKNLTLEWLNLPWSAMSTIGKLPNLEVLKLRREACEGAEWNVEDGEFLKLKYLGLFFLDVKQIIVSSSEPFPCLEVLSLRGCYILEEIPCCFGDIYTLNTIRALHSSYKVARSVRRILKQQRDMGNQSLQVFITEAYMFEVLKLDDDDDDDYEDDEEILPSQIQFDIISNSK